MTHPSTTTASIPTDGPRLSDAVIVSTFNRAREIGLLPGPLPTSPVSQGPRLFIDGGEVTVRGSMDGVNWCHVHGHEGNYDLSSWMRYSINIAPPTPWGVGTPLVALPRWKDDNLPDDLHAQWNTQMQVRPDGEWVKYTDAASAQIHYEGLIRSLCGLLHDSVTCLIEAKCKLAPRTTNSDADVAIMRSQQALDALRPFHNG